VFGELEQLSVSLRISFVLQRLSPVRPTLSPGHPTPFSAGRVVVQQLHLVFGTNRSAQKESVPLEQEFFSYHWSISHVRDHEELGDDSMSCESNALAA
jgi:hypothetical protein